LGCNVWNANANENEAWLNNAYRKGEDDLGRIYGVQARHWTSIYSKEIDGTSNYTLHEVDQLQTLINTLRSNCYDRRMIVTHWNPGELNQMALPPCHMLYQVFVRNEDFMEEDIRYLDMMMVQRSVDVGLGLPFNIASYALLLNMISLVTGFIPGKLHMILNDVHVYSNHESQLLQQCGRTPFDLPKIMINPGVCSIDDFKPEDFALVDYKHHSAIKMDMAV